MRRGMTLIEITISIALMAILIGVYFIVANPAGQLASSRNAERKLQLQTIMNAVRQNVADSQNGQFQCVIGPLPTTSKRMTSAVGAGNYDIAQCLIGPSNPYIYALPFDPSASGAHYTSVTDYDTAYNVSISSTTGVITLSAPYTETSTVSTTISISR